MKLRMLVASMAVIPIALLTGSLTAQADDEVRSGTDAMAAEAVRMQQLFVELYNDRKFEELAARYYAEDAIVLPPSTEPVRGRAAIVAYFNGVRDGFGEIEISGAPLRSAVSGNLVSVIGQYSAHHGQLRAVTHETYERQPDGSLLTVHDQFGFRDPLR